jgi:hypothetical protein
MSVISIETRKANELAATSNIGDSSIFMVHDGTGLKRITFEDVKRAMVYPNAGSHNSIYRGKYLGSTVTQAQYTAIRNGTFDDLFIGDYWTIGGINYRIAAFDYFYNTGNIPCVIHHLVIVPDQCLYKTKMNDSQSTNMGYVGTTLYTTGLNQAKSIVTNAFQGHVISHKLLHSNAAVNGVVTNSVWCDSYIDLMSEIMAYGTNILSRYSVSQYIVEKYQLPLFALDPSKLMIDRAHWWLKDIVSDSGFAMLHGDNVSFVHNVVNEGGVRPHFCIS